MRVIILRDDVKKSLKDIFPAVTFRPDLITSHEMQAIAGKTLYQHSIDYFKDSERFADVKTNKLFCELDNLIASSKTIFLVSVPFGNELNAGLTIIEGTRTYNVKIPFDHTYLFYDDPIEFLGEVLYSGIMLSIFCMFDDDSLRAIRETIIPYYKIGYTAKLSFFDYMSSKYGINCEPNKARAIKHLADLLADH